MHTLVYNRLCGWLYFALSLVGFFQGRLGAYMRMSLWECWAYLCIGLAGMGAARIRHRDATLVSVLLGFLLGSWGIAGFVQTHAWWGSNEPLENAIRLLSGLWGLYCAVTDVLTLRNRWKGQG